MDLRSDPWLGATLAGRYFVVARMGAGGMGVVYRAWDYGQDRYVVVKTPRRELLGDGKFVVRFEQELSSLRSLSFSSIVPIVDVGDHEGVPYAVMPYLAGGSLKQRRSLRPDRTYAPETPASLWRWLPAVAQAIDFVHASGYVHRDIKPDNILFDGHGRPFLGDFGVAKTVLQTEASEATRGLTGTGFALGTPDYMAPELVSGVKPAPPVDQYALAVMAYELLAGRKPFDGPTPAAILIAHVSGEAPPLATLCPTVPRSAIAAVERGMHREPARRFDSCAAFTAAVLADIAKPPEADRMQLLCPQCDRLLNVKPGWAGKQGNCPRCKAALAIANDLASLWIPGERGDEASSSKLREAARFGATPSAPVTLPRSAPSVGPVVQASAAAEICRTFASSRLLQAVSACVAAFVLLAVMFVPSATSDRGNEPDVVLPPVAKSAESVVEPPRERETVAAEPPREEPPASPPLVPPPIAAVEAPKVPDTDAPVPTAESDLHAPMPSIPTAGEAAQAIDEPAADPAPEPRPVPDAAQVAAATELIKQAFADAYEAARRRQGVAALIDRLDSTQNETDDPVRRYALLLEAERLATEAGELLRALSFVSTRGTLFAVDSTTEKLELMSRLAKPTPEAAGPLFEEFVEAAYAHLADDEYEVAGQLSAAAMRLAKVINREQKVAESQARKKKPSRTMTRRPLVPKNKPVTPVTPVTDEDGESLIEEAEALARRVDEQTTKHEAYASALKTLENTPDDPDAHEAAGRFLCFMKAAWREGLPHLSLGRDEPLADLARRQAAMEQSSPGTMFAIAGEWWDACDESSLSEFETDAARELAAVLYRDVLPRLGDPIEIALATKRAAAAREGVVSGVGSSRDLVGPAAVPLTATSGTAAGAKPGARGDPFAGRKKAAARKQLVEAHGGTAETEAAVDAALEWLSEHQMPDGGWALNFQQCPACQGACANPGSASHQEDRGAATAIALLPFLGRGQSHRDGAYRKELLAGINFLAGLSTAGNGKCYGRQGSLYSQGLAAIALAEAYGLTKDVKLKAPAQAAVNYIMESQDPQGGGWRYVPRQPGDTSVTGWQIAALKTASAAGLSVNPVVLARANVFLNSVQQDNGTAYGYTNPGSTYSTSAIGLLCRSYLGTRGAVPQFGAGVERIASQGSNNDLYFNYYATALLREVGGATWESWNRTLQQRLLASQGRDGHEQGSWFAPFSSGMTADVGGRLLATSLATLILEAPYRRLEHARP